jgi:hypothetical protein
VKTETNDVMIMYWLKVSTPNWRAKYAAIDPLIANMDMSIMEVQSVVDALEVINSELPLLIDDN